MLTVHVLMYYYTTTYWTYHLMYVTWQLASQIPSVQEIGVGELYCRQSYIEFVPMECIVM